eukprot:TRINITY_DN4973_c0_g1_i1.p1 TRINITY_DN4973_c0_g1~~TRINITY_DN4973_c0_g1_i1.p1  ORF type:complete len:1063 (-),score=239.90 TRINITY_DN4973_c0_g1_i1:77-3100(-)
MANTAPRGSPNGVVATAATATASTTEDLPDHRPDAAAEIARKRSVSTAVFAAASLRARAPPTHTQFHTIRTAELAARGHARLASDSPQTMHGPAQAMLERTALAQAHAQAAQPLAQPPAHQLQESDSQAATHAQPPVQMLEHTHQRMASDSSQPTTEQQVDAQHPQAAGDHTTQQSHAKTLSEQSRSASSPNIIDRIPSTPPPRPPRPAWLGIGGSDSLSRQQEEFEPRKSYVPELTDTVEPEHIPLIAGEDKEIAFSRVQHSWELVIKLHNCKSRQPSTTMRQREIEDRMKDVSMWQKAEEGWERAAKYNSIAGASAFVSHKLLKTLGKIKADAVSRTVPTSGGVGTTTALSPNGGSAGGSAGVGRKEGSAGSGSAASAVGSSSYKEDSTLSPGSGAISQAKIDSNVGDAPTGGIPTVGATSAFGIHRAKIQNDRFADQLRQWQPFLDRWKGDFQNVERRLDLRATIRKYGIPTCLKRQMWLILSGAAAYMKKTYPNVTFASIREQHAGQTNQYIPQIEKDLTRTMLTVRAFRCATARESLRQVLGAYSWQNPAVGYCQAMNFLTAALLLFLTEEETFCVLVTIIDNMLPRNFYGQDLEAILVETAVLNKLAFGQVPAVMKHLADMGIVLDVFAVRWFLTLTVSAFPLQTAFRTLDMFFFEGNRILFRVILGMLKLREPEILRAKDPQQLMELLNSLPSEVYNPDKLVEASYSLHLAGQSRIEHYRKKALELIEQEKAAKQPPPQARSPAAEAPQQEQAPGTPAPEQQQQPPATPVSPEQQQPATPLQPQPSSTSTPSPPQPTSPPSLSPQPTPTSSPPKPASSTPPQLASPQTAHARAPSPQPTTPPPQPTSEPPPQPTPPPSPQPRTPPAGDLPPAVKRLPQHVLNSMQHQKSFANLKTLLKESAVTELHESHVGWLKQNMERQRSVTMNIGELMASLDEQAATEAAAPPAPPVPVACPSCRRLVAPRRFCPACNSKMPRELLLLQPQPPQSPLAAAVRVAVAQ